MSKTVTQVENRGTAEVPYGYVYMDDTRVGFSIETRKFPKPTMTIWASRPSGRWPTPSGRQFYAAKLALVHAGFAASVRDVVRT
jgi:hypothetical protein